jgi:hypothetical protein
MLLRVTRSLSRSPLLRVRTDSNSRRKRKKRKKKKSKNIMRKMMPNKSMMKNESNI